MILYAYLIDYPNTKMRIVIGVISPAKGFTTNNTIERLVTENVSIAPHKVINWCKKNNPKMIVSDLDGSNEMVYDYLNGYVGEQLKLEGI